MAGDRFHVLLQLLGCLSNRVDQPMSEYVLSYRLASKKKAAPIHPHDSRIYHVMGVLPLPNALRNSANHQMGGRPYIVTGVFIHFRLPYLRASLLFVPPGVGIA